MPEKRTEPWVMASMTELLSFARAMEQEAVDGYIALAARMRAPTSRQSSTAWSRKRRGISERWTNG